MNEQEPGGAGGGSRFDPTRYLRQLRGRGGTTDYLDVKWRLVWLRSEHPDAQIVTEHISITPEMAIFKATVTIPGGGSASGYGSETPKDFGDFLEKAETKALGRALIALGYGTQFAQEFGEDEAADPPIPAPAPRRGETAPARPPAPRPEVSAPLRAAPAPAASVEPVGGLRGGPATVPPTPPRAESIPADTRRPAPPRPLREVTPPPAHAASAPAAGEDDGDPFGDDPFGDDDFAKVVLGAPAPTPESPVRNDGTRAGRGGGPAPQPSEGAMPRRGGRTADAEGAAPPSPARLSSPQPAPRPAPRPAPAAVPVVPRDAEDAGDEEIDMANYGWTEFWSWARTRGYTDRKALDAIVGRDTRGMTPLEIRKQIQAKQG